MHMELGPLVEPDLDDIAGFIAEDNPERAISFIAEIGKRFEEVAQNPLIYCLRPDEVVEYLSDTRPRLS